MFEKHLIECQCSLKVFDSNKIIYHKIPVISFYDENNKIKEKYVICNNCNIVHRVYEVFKSEIKWGMENLKSLVNTVDDIEQNLIFHDQQSLCDLLRKEDVLTHDWEYIEYLIENQIDGNIILQKTESDNNIVCRILEIKNNKFRIRKETFQRYA